MPLVSASVLLLLAWFGFELFALIPRMLVGATIFLLAYQLMRQWLFENVPGFQPIDYLIVGIILATVMVAGFIAGIVTGIALALVLFVLRYSMMSPIHGRYSLQDLRSSVERQAGTNRILDSHGSGAVIYTLRGFLFFGTANAILDRIKTDLKSAGERTIVVLLDFKRVTGMDSSALNTFMMVKAHCESNGVQLLYSSVSPHMQSLLGTQDTVSEENGRALFFEELDYAIEHIEEKVLSTLTANTASIPIRVQLQDIFDNDAKIDLLMHALERYECQAGDTLFSRGDPDTGFYILESGALSAFIGAPDAPQHRVKKFGPGSLIGELSMFVPDKRRTATVVADVDSVLYYMSSVVLDDLDLQQTRLAGAIHELIARTLGERMNYMNQRLLLELD